MHTRLIACTVALAGVLNAGCAGHGGRDTAMPADTPAPGGDADQPADTHPAPAQTPQPAAVPDQRVVYFDFDSSTARPESRTVVMLNARYLATHPNVRVTVAGYADERGTREYNLALSGRRADGIRGQLLMGGVAPAQLKTIAYGEEYPVDPGHDEQAWRNNRRVELQYADLSRDAANP